MLYPKMNRSRTIVDLGGIWKFKLGDETEPGESQAELQDADIIYVPASFNDQKEDPAYRNHYAWNLELDFWEKLGNPVMMTEYGADTLPGLHNCVPEMFSEEFQVEFYKMYSKAFDGRTFFIGEQVWNFADFATIQGCMRADGNRKGIFTRDRRPKMIAHYFRERWDKIPDFGYKKNEQGIPCSF